MSQHNQIQLPLSEDLDPPENEFIRLARILWNRKYLIIFIVALFTVIAAVQLKRATPIFVAKTEMVYEPYGNRFFEEGEIGRPINSQSEILTQIEIIKSPVIASAVIEALGSQSNQPASESKPSEQKDVPEEFNLWTPVETISSAFTSTKRELRNWIVPTPQIDLPQEIINEQNAIRRMQNRVSVVQKPGRQIIIIQARHPKSKMAAAIANEFAHQYEVYLESGRTTTYQDAQTFFSDQLEIAKEDVENAEKDFFNYSIESDLNLLTRESELVVNQIQELIQEIFELEKQQSLYQGTESMMSTEEIQAYLLEQDPSYTALQSRLSELYVEQVKLAAENLPSHREAQRLEREIEALEVRLSEEQQRFITSRQSEQKIIASNLIQLRKKKTDLEKTNSEINQKTIQLNVLQRDVDAKKALYDVLLRDFNEINVSARVESSAVRITEEAIPPRVANEPRVGRRLFTNAFMGFMIGCFIAIGLSYIDRSIGSAKEMERILRLPTLGTIPFMGSLIGKKGTTQASGKRAPIRLLDSFDNYAKEVESFRLLRTSLQYSSAIKPPQIVMITSVNPSEGKSTVSANLALSYSTLNKKTLIVDADLKLPSMHTIFATERQPGLTDILVGEKNLDEIVQATQYENLYLLTAGHATVNPAEMLESDRMNELLAQFRSEYDQIIIDSTPVQGLADPLALAAKTDGICLVGSVGKTNSDDLKRNVDRMRQLDLKILGVIYNHKVRSSKSATDGYGKYGKYGKSGQYGSYGYYRKDTAEKTDESSES